MGLVSNFWLPGDVGIFPVHLHQHEKGAYFLWPCLLVQVDDVEESQDASPDVLHFVN